MPPPDPDTEHLLREAAGGSPDACGRLLEHHRQRLERMVRSCPMTPRSWLRKLFARPVTRPVRKAPARCRPALEALEDRAPPTITPKSAGGKAKQHRGAEKPREQAPGSLVHTGRFSPVTIGFWLGGAGMGTGGCLLGALMPYRHPVAVAVSVLWWGIYLGCLGGSVGALVALFTERAPAPASRGGEGRSQSAAPATRPVACSVPQEERVDCYDHKPEREDRPERMDEQAENQGLHVIRPGALEE